MNNENDRTVMFYFPDTLKASSLRVVQDPISQIRAFYFTNSQIVNVEVLDHANNHAVYFLFSDVEEPSVYIGQSINGIGRIKSHLREKDFWSFAILFVTDNNMFDKLSIDYLEHYFIHAFAKTQYILENRDLRNTQPNINVFNRSTFRSYAKQIEFLLEAVGVSLQPVAAEPKEAITYFNAPSSYKAKIYLRDGKFVLSQGSIIRKPVDSTKSWKDGGSFYTRYEQHFINYVETNQAILIDENSAELKYDIEFSSPSMPAELCSGGSKNGWDFWKGLKEKREEMN